MRYLIPKESNGLIEIFIASSIFFSPNILLFLPFFRNNIYLFLIYEFLLIYLLTSVITHKHSQLLAISREKNIKQ